MSRLGKTVRKYSPYIIRVGRCFTKQDLRWIAEGRPPRHQSLGLCAPPLAIKGVLCLASVFGKDIYFLDSSANSVFLQA